MADNKRNMHAGRVATPRTAITPNAQPSMVDATEALGKAIGARVRLTTSAPHSQTYEGTLFTACSILNIVAINTRNPSSNGNDGSAGEPGDYSVIPIAKIQSFQILSIAESTGSDAGGFANAVPSIGAVDIKRLRERENARIQELKEQLESQGKGVTREAQAIYDSFRRINMPTRWHNQEIIVYDAVIIAPPYRVEDCKGARDKQEVLSRVRKVLEGERRKLKEKEEKDGKRAIGAAGPRKGG